MNRHTTNKRSKYLNMGMIFYVLFFFCGIGTIANVMSTKAAPSNNFTSTDTTPTSTPTSSIASAASTPTVSVTPTQITPPPTPTDTSTEDPTDTPTPTPTSRHRYTPTPTATATSTSTPIPTATPVPTSTSTPTATPTATDNTVSTPTATPTSTATPTTVPTLPTVTPDNHGPNPKHTGPDKPGSGRGNARGPDVLMLSLGISTPLLFFGGSLFWLYLRRNQQVIAALQKWKKPALSANTLWRSDHNRVTSSTLPQVSDPFTARPTYAAIPMTSVNENIISGANTQQQPISSSVAELTEPLYRPSDLRPMTMSLPTPVTNPPIADLKLYPATSNMNPLPLDMFVPAQDTAKSREPEHAADQPVPTTIPENLASTAKIDSPPATPMANTLLSAAPETLPVQLLDITDDPVLENVMRQAQLGLFIIPGYKKS